MQDRGDRGQGRKVEGVRLSASVPHATGASGPRGRGDRRAPSLVCAQAGAARRRDSARSVGTLLPAARRDAKYAREWFEPIGRLQEWLAEHARLDPRSEQAKVLLPELAAQVEEAEQAQAATVLAVSTLHFHTERREPKPILARSWRLAEGKHKCQYARPAVIELGEQQGRFIQVCIEKKKCAKHWRQQKTGVNSSAQRADDDRRRADEERRRQEQERRRAIFEQHIRPNTLTALAAATQRRPLKGLVFLEVLKQLRPSSRDEEFIALVGEPAKVPPARFAQACVVAIALGLAWNPDHLGGSRGDLA